MVQERTYTIILEAFSKVVHHFTLLELYCEQVISICCIK